MEGLESPTPGQNWKFAVGFVLGVLVTLIIIIVLANKYGLPPTCASAPAAPVEPQVLLPSIVTPDAPASGTETYQHAPF